MAVSHIKHVFEGSNAQKDVDAFFEDLLGPDDDALYSSNTTIQVSSISRF